MIRRIFVTLASIGMLVVAIYYIRNINIYTPDQLNNARIKAVEQARDGDFSAALKRLNILVKYDKKNRMLWYDYLSVLHWAGEHDDFFQYLDKADFNNPPDYFLDTCLSVIRTYQGKDYQARITKLMEKLLASKSVSESKYFRELYLTSQDIEQKELFLTVLEKRSPQHPLLKTVKIENMVNLARDGEIENALQLFENELPAMQNDQEFLAEYITVNNWARDHEKVLSMTPYLDIDQLPEYSLLALADSYQAAGSLSGSLGYYRQLNEKYPDQNYTVKAVEIQTAIEKEKADRTARLKRERAERLAEIERQRIEAERILLSEAQEAARLKEELWFKNATITDMNNALKKNPYSQKYFVRWQALAAEKRGVMNVTELDFIAANLAGHPKNSLLFQDYLVILSWNEQFDKVLELYKAHASEIKGQAYFYEAVAVSAKNAKQYALSIQTYDKALTIKPGDKDLILGKASALQLNNQPDLAIDLINTLDAKELANLDIGFRLADSHRQNSAWGKAVEQYNVILASDPDNQKALQNKANVLLEQNLPFLAYDIAVQHPDAIDRDTRVAIHSAMNTYNMRLTNDDSDLAMQKQAVVKAKVTNATYIAELERGPHTSKDINNAYSDQIRLDYLSKDYNKVINSYRKIQQTAPSYILNEVSSALLAQKHPQEALVIAKEQIVKEPKSFSALSNAYYASLELEDYVGAQSYLDTLDKVIPVWFYSEDGKRSIKNPKREALELMKVMHVAYQNNLPKAEAELFDLVSKAPGNNEYRANLSTIYRWRGWFDKSQEELNIIENSDSGYLLKDITQTYLDMDQQEFTKAALAVASISENYPDSDQVKQLLKNWNLANRNLLSVSARQANPKGSTFSSRDQTVGLEWISQPFANHWRSLTFTEHSTAKFGNQHGQITKFGTGLNYRHNWGDVTGKIFKMQDSQGIDASLAGTWLINDYFFMHAGLQSFSDQTPVRAFDSGVSASSYNVGITYRPHELKEFSLSSNVANFSDGNARFSASAKAVRNLYRDQHSNLDLSGFLYWQGNESDTNRNYFNPKSIWSVSSALEFEKLIYRYYEKSLSHNVRLEIGQVTQHAFDSELFYSLDYFQRLQFSNALAITYGFGYASTYYDGLNEKGPKINFGLEYKF